MPLARLKRRLGDQAHRELDALMQAALAEQASSGDTSLHLAWITLLLTRYYDPMYLYQLGNKRERILFRVTSRLASTSLPSSTPESAAHQEDPIC
jgi:tRNA 2-selenouridine synthase